MADLEQIARESRSSIELHRDSKGTYSFTIKRYYADGDEEQALTAIKAIDAVLFSRYIGGAA